MRFRSVVLSGLAVLVLNTTDVYAAPLITAKEAKLPDAAGGLNTRGISRGPGIKVVSPEAGVQNKGPFEFKVDFEPRGGATIDKSSIKVIYMKSPVVDLTPRIKGALTDNGFDLKNAEIPPGEHQIKIMVKDSDGREASMTTTLISAK
ncbi:MAG: hypothetical protein RIQ55_159 [Pseudomonadota bacterium]|jgi:hypothetical protein